MSIFTRIYFGAVMAALSTPALALNTIAPMQPPSAPLGVMLAQNSPTVLSDRDISRINHYSEQLIVALMALEEGPSAVTVLRQRVQRMVDAGERSGMTLRNTADYFEAYLAENTTAPLPAVLYGADGRFDAHSLFSTAMLYFTSTEGEAVDIAAIEEADLAAIGSIAQQAAPVAQPSLQLSVTVLPTIEPTN